MSGLRHKCSKPGSSIILRVQIHKSKSEVPSTLHRVLVNGKSASRHDHTLIEQILEVSVVSFSDSFAAMTKQGDMQRHKGYYI